jgi:twitching motility protein PilT
MNKELPEELPAASEQATAPIASFERTRPHRGSPETDAFLRAVVKMGASDLHLKSGESARLRIGGELRMVAEEPDPTEEFEARVFHFLTEDERRQLIVDGSVDLAYDLDDQTRFRVNVYRQDAGISIAARVVPRSIPSFEDLHLPSVVAKIADNRQGLILVSGTTGSGKSTTIAAILEHINHTRNEHIVTIEDPIEFLHTSRKCLINQREIGINVKDFPTALRALLREDPDVVLIGEMRDAETFRSALQAADTGHLVVSTVHAESAAQTVNRLLNMFPEDERPSVRKSLVFSLRAIMAQKLLKSTAADVNRVPAVEVLVSTPIVRKLIDDGREMELGDVIRTGDEGMLSYAESLLRLYHDKLIDAETGRHAAPNEEEFKRLLAGIKTSQAGIVG